MVLHMTRHTLDVVSKVLQEGSPRIYLEMRSGRSQKELSINGPTSVRVLPNSSPDVPAKKDTLPLPFLLKRNLNQVLSLLGRYIA